ncbi:MAG: cbb3-type cytochrome c oxidase subunit I, partial [Anaerolineae bacterium]
GGWDSGWTAYPPLSARAPVGQTLMFLAVYLVGFSSILGAINFITTTVKSRAPGLGFFRLPLFVWTALAASLLALGFTQFIAMSFLLVVFERILGMGFFTPEKGGAPFLFQHLFWFYSHPAVYIMIFPWWGVVSEVLPVFARKPLFAYKWMIRIAVLGVFALSPIVWVHHLYPAGVEGVLRVPQMFTTELISVPTGFFFLGWLGTLWLGKLRLRTPMLFALSFVVVFLIGGLTGIPNAEVQTDLYLHDTYWVMAHFHFTLGSMVFGLMAAFYYWLPKITGRMYNEALGRLHWGLMTTGFLVATLPMMGLGLMGMRRRIGDYEPGLGFEPLHMAATIGTFLVALSVVVFLVNVVGSVLRGARAPANPWDSRTLEWHVPSPPPEENFERIPQVVGSPYPYGVPGAVHALVAPAGASNGER